MDRLCHPLLNECASVMSLVYATGDLPRETIGLRLGRSFCRPQSKADQSRWPSWNIVMRDDSMTFSFDATTTQYTFQGMTMAEVYLATPHGQTAGHPPAREKCSEETCLPCRTSPPMQATPCDSCRFLLAKRTSSPKVHLYRKCNKDVRTFSQYLSGDPGYARARQTAALHWCESILSATVVESWRGCSPNISEAVGARS